MQELSLNVLDLAQNSIRAGASQISVAAAEHPTEHLLTITVSDNGCGMTKKEARQAEDPFFTTRTTRKIGLGIPFFKEAAELTGGSFSLRSASGKGTTVTASFHTDHIDCRPLGDMDATILSLVAMNPTLDLVYTRSIDSNAFVLDTRELKKILGDVPLNEPDILRWIRSTLEEGTAALRKEVPDII